MYIKPNWGCLFKMGIINFVLANTESLLSNFLPDFFHGAYFFRSSSEIIIG